MSWLPVKPTEEQHRRVAADWREAKRVVALEREREDADQPKAETAEA